MSASRHQRAVPGLGLAALCLFAGCLGSDDDRDDKPAIYPFPSSSSDPTDELRHGSAKEVALAARLRPYLFFDATERWRPLEVDAFRTEQFKDGAGHHLWSPRTYLEIHGNQQNGSDYHSPAANGCVSAQDAHRQGRATPNCDEGAPTAVYYRRTTHGGLWFWDYWAFYRFNDYTGRINQCWFVCDDHEGDWEGVTVVTTRSRDAPELRGTLFAEHTDRIAVAPSATVMTGEHMDVYVASGTHASYRFKCSHKCDQHIAARPEEAHDGTRPWTGNDDPTCLRIRCIRPLPDSGRSDDDTPAHPSAWNGWTARWGSTCQAGCHHPISSGPSPRAPGSQARFDCPWAATRVDRGREAVTRLVSALPAVAHAPRGRPGPCARSHPAPELTVPLLVALGDSYSSGEGVGQYDAATDTRRNSCHRSAYAWPLLVADRLRLQSDSLACSGAKTPEVLTSGARTDELERSVSQISRIDRRPEILTITIGGNDAGFADVLSHCVIENDCVTRYTNSGHDEIQAKILGLEKVLERLYVEVQRVVPGTRLVVVDYPRIFPRAYPRRHNRNCAAWDRISDREASWLNDRGRALDDAIARATERAHVEFVEIANAFDGHELSCEGGSYVNPLRLRAAWPPYTPESFHPTGEGQARIAEIVTGKLGG